MSRVFKRKLELTSTQKVTFLNKNETRRYESVQGTPLPSSKVYDSAKKVSYFEQAFKIEAKIGSGCFGNVYRVKSKEDGKLYAVRISNFKIILGFVKLFLIVKSCRPWVLVYVKVLIFR